MRATPRGRRLLVITYAIVLAWGIWATRDVDSDKPTSLQAPSRSVESGKVLPTWTAPSAVVTRTPSRETPRASRSRMAGGNGRLNWAALAECESSGNPRALSPSGKYRGLYQFDLRTWRSVGGSGDPIEASSGEQTRRAQLLYASRGRQPWPECGGRL